MEMLIQVWEKNEETKTLRIEGTGFSIGRSDCEVVLNDRNCSRAHAEVYMDESGQVWVNDLNSTNGTFVNGIRILENALIQVGDTLQLGETFVRVLAITEGITQVPPLPKRDSLTGWPEFVFAKV